NIIALLCISEYPAKIEQYEKAFNKQHISKLSIDLIGKLNAHCSVSDHIVGLNLYKKYQPQIWEKHFKLPKSTGLDAGPFAITPEELREIL
ncbi:MAG: hypothetical protein PHY56_06965, partial [Candidatus Omnitrophica bacterium]|nr:hypothetical protein [Candidatus Omnitrophota bacterium]